MASSFLMLPSTNIPQNSEYVECVGSSHGWLTYLDQHANPTLVDPFSGIRIPLPPSNTLPLFDSNSLSSSRKIRKVFLSSNPSYAKNYSVVVLFGFQSHMKIAFCRGGDEEWNDLDREGNKTYYDVVIDEATNMAFAVGPPLSVASWDLNEVVPVKKMIIQDSCPTFLRNNQDFPRDLYSSQWYLALSSLEQIYLVVRYIGEFVRYDGTVVYEGDTLTDDAAEPLVCPYRTMAFHVFKLDANRNEWVKVESLNNLALFLGGNQSTMLSTIGQPELEMNAIYFTDDYWERVDEDYAYGGHDMGVYKLQDATICPILDSQQQKIDPPPFWVIKST